MAPIIVSQETKEKLSILEKETSKLNTDQAPIDVLRRSPVSIPKYYQVNNDQLDELKKSGTLYNHSDLVNISNWCRDSLDNFDKFKLDPNDYTLRSLTRNAEIYAPSPPKPKRSRELEKILQDAEAEAYRRERESKDNQVPILSEAEMEIEWKKIRKELGAIFNVIASMLAIAIAFWHLTSTNFSAPARVGFSMISAFTLGGIETFLYVRYFNNANKPKRPTKRLPSKMAFEHDGKKVIFIPEGSRSIDNNKKKKS